MPIPVHGPWCLNELPNDHVLRLPEAIGNYLVSIPEKAYHARAHGPCRFLYIGGMTDAENSSLRRRIGQFIAAALDLANYHSGGHRFSCERQDHHINPWNLEFWWYEHNDPLCGEVCLFEEFAQDFGRQLPLLNKNRRRKGCREPRHEPAMICPWR